MTEDIGAARIPRALGSKFWVPHFRELAQRSGAHSREAAARSNGNQIETYLLVADILSYLPELPLEGATDNAFLEVGCGSGIISEHLVREVGYSKWFGVEPCVELARECCARAEVLMHHIAVKSIIYPTVLDDFPAIQATVVGSVLQYLDPSEVEAALKIIWNRTTPGGKCVLQSVPMLRMLDEYLSKCPPNRVDLNLKAQWFDPFRLDEVARGVGWSSVDLRTPNPRLWFAPYYFDMVLTK